MSLVPAKYRFGLSNLKQFLRGGYRSYYYSQYGEDIILRSLFKGKRDGLYVDVGAHHPERYSNTKLLYDAGWRGINIEPDRESYMRFVHKRPGDTNLNVGVGAKAGALTYHRFSDPALNTFDAGQAKQWMGKPWVAYLGESTVDVQPLSSILESHASGAAIDLLTIDAEGMDADVLRSNNWQKYRPSVVVVENSSEDLRDILAGQGYTLYCMLGKSSVWH